MFSGMKTEDFMESEHSGIFWVELVTKNVVLGFLGTHLMHMRVKIKTLKNDKWIPAKYLGKIHIAAISTDMGKW